MSRLPTPDERWGPMMRVLDMPSARPRATDRMDQAVVATRDQPARNEEPPDRIELPADVREAFHAYLLVLAARDGDLGQCRYLVAAGANPVAHDTPSGSAPFTAAVHGGHIDVVRFFVEECKIDLQRAFGGAVRSQLLRHAVSRHRFEIARLLVRAGVDPAVDCAVYGLPPPRLALLDHDEEACDFYAHECGVPISTDYLWLQNFGRKVDGWMRAYAARQDRRRARLAFLLARDELPWARQPELFDRNLARLVAEHV